MKPLFRAGVVAVPLLAALAAAPAQAATPGHPTHPDGVVVSHPAPDNSALRIRVPAAAQADSVNRASAQYLRYTQQTQKYDEWCWAADGSSIENYYGYGISQDQFCAAAKGTAVGYCPNETGALDQIVNGFRQTGFSANETGGALYWNTVRSEIDAGRPAMTVISWSSGGAHAQTIYGYDASSGTISTGDPWPAYQRYQTYTYNSYLQNSNFTWTDTVDGIARP
ncbi:papain-like cysteine protease family protein [Amycolatopsis sp. PS_44_ISF1]|uniref:papain-like cysteine protease family protein n=1 Tax=Amycolatopsis sp. PS_44_ISF1 TaxID=2974917 RepID=UPI0028DF9B84|nr:papain-like cysteine protease family protein [Amycolatopsis sp. PS_44_ISF1]MDT8910130.1 C39 family peptidase [Amycolatopsis sp. PS_44_ISF1]